MVQLTAKKVSPKATHRKFSPGRQVVNGKGSTKGGSNRGKAFANPPIAKVGKIKKKK